MPPAAPDAILLRLTGATTAAAAVATGFGAAAQAVTGFGSSLVCAPVLVVVLGARHGVQLINMLSIVVNIALLVRERSGVRAGDAMRLLVPAAIVTPAAAYAVHRTDASVLSIVAGLLIATSALALAAGIRVSRLRGAAGAAVAGIVSAAMNTAGGVGGPAAAMYATNAGWLPESLRPTLQLYFLGLNIVTVIALGPVDPGAAGATVLLAALVVGLVVGSVVADRLPAATVGRAVLVLAFAGGLVAIGRGVLG